MLDSEVGLWLVEPDGQEVILSPATSTQVWLLLVELTREIEAGP